MNHCVHWIRNVEATGRGAARRRYTAVNNLDPNYDTPECEDFTREQGRIAVWAMCRNVTDAPLDRQYSRAFYTAVLMMLGGDAYPTDPVEELFTSLVMLIGIFTSSVTVA